MFEFLFANVSHTLINDRSQWLQLEEWRANLMIWIVADGFQELENIFSKNLSISWLCFFCYFPSIFVNYLLSWHIYSRHRWHYWRRKVSKIFSKLIMAITGMTLIFRFFLLIFRYLTLSLFTYDIFWLTTGIKGLFRRKRLICLIISIYCWLF